MCELQRVRLISIVQQLCLFGWKEVIRFLGPLRSLWPFIKPLVSLLLSRPACVNLKVYEDLMEYWRPLVSPPARKSVSHVGIYAIKIIRGPRPARPLIPWNPNCSRQIGPWQIGFLADLAANWAPHFFVHQQIGKMLVRQIGPLYYVNVCIVCI